MHDWVKSNPAFEDVIYHEHFLSVIPPPRDGPNAEFMRRCDRDMSRNVLVSPSASQSVRPTDQMDSHLFAQAEHF
jgi:hypothetical protein